MVFVGIPGLRWTDVSPRDTPNLWRLAAGGSAGTLVVRTVLPRACPVDGWLTLNAGARAIVRHTEKGVCPAVPSATPAGLAGIARYNRQFHYNAHWGLLASAAGHGGCVTALGPGAALAVARLPGQQSQQDIASHYLPDAARVSRSVMARCGLTVADLGTLPSAAGRAAAVRADDTILGRIAAARQPGGILVVAAPADVTSPHLRVLVVSGAGYPAGLLATASTREPGLVQLTDLTAAILTWRHQPRPADLVGSPLTRQARGSLAAAVRALIGQDTAAQVYRSTSGWFFAAYAVGDGIVFGAIALLCWGASGRKRRHAWARIAGVFAGAVLPASFLASVVPWWLLPHPAAVLYSLTAGWAAVIGLAALRGPWRHDLFGPAGVVGAITVAVIGLDVMTGSRLQLGTPFGLSTLLAGRFYGVGNNALGPYGAAGILAAVWAAGAVVRRRLAIGSPRVSGAGRPPAPPGAGTAEALRPGAGPAETGRPGAGPAEALGPGAGPAERLAVTARKVSAGLGGPRRREAALAVAAVAAFTVIASGWPGFGSKFGGTVAMVPGFIVLGLRAAGVRVTARWASLITVSGVAAVTVFALVNYFLPVTGHSHIGEFVGQVLHGGAGGVLHRKISSNIGSLTITPYSPLVPIVVAGLGLLLLRPRWFGARWLPGIWAAQPVLRATMAAMWLVAVLGWLADDSGVTVAAAALPFALPLAIAIHASALDATRTQVSRRPLGGRATGTATPGATGRRAGGVHAQDTDLGRSAGSRSS